MPDQAVNEMISAFAAGCMDKENFVNFVKYISAKGELPYKELGHLQTLVSMLPVILEPEQPDPELKNKVARTLISMKDEIKEKIKSGRYKTIETQKFKRANESLKSTSDTGMPRNQQNENRPAPENYSRTPDIPAESAKNNYMMTENKLFTENPSRMPEGPSFTPVWIIMALLFLALCGIAYYAYSNNNELKDTISKTEASLTSIKSELRSTNEYINRNSALVDFFNYDDIWVIPLEGNDPALKVTGKLFIASNEKAALLQISNLPTPSPDNIYQLWLITKDQTYSAGNFFVEPGSRFVKLTGFPQVPKAQVQQFKITLEPRGGSPLPTGMTYAVGLGTDVPQKQGRRK